MKKPIKNAMSKAKAKAKPVAKPKSETLEALQRPFTPLNVPTTQRWCDLSDKRQLEVLKLLNDRSLPVKGHIGLPSGGGYTEGWIERMQVFLSRFGPYRVSCCDARKCGKMTRFLVLTPEMACKDEDKYKFRWERRPVILPLDTPITLYPEWQP